MSPRTYELFAAVADRHRLRVLLAVLEAGEIRPHALQDALHMSQTTVSRALGQLRDVGLVERGNQRTPFRVPQPRETRMLLSSAALIEYAWTRDPEAAALATHLRRQDMTRGADEPRAGRQADAVE